MTTIKALLRLNISTALIVGLTGCAGTVMNRFSLEEGTSITTGSRQRVMTNNTPGENTRPGLVDPKRIVCIEPSPDVAVAVANSLNVGLGRLGLGSGTLSSGSAEGLIQLAERTVSIQLLRDQMYRACEAYANGAISGTTYNLMMSKNNDAMVTLMLGETAAGRFGRSLGAIGGGSSGLASASITELKADYGVMAELQEDLAKAEADLQDAESKIEDKKAVTEASEEGSEGQADAKKQTQQAEVEKQVAEEHVKKLRKQLASSTASAAAKIDRLVGAGSISSQPTAEIASQLGAMQKRFLDEDFIDEYVSACIVELGLQPGTTAYTPFSYNKNYTSGEKLPSDQLNEYVSKSIAKLAVQLTDEIKRGAPPNQVDAIKENIEFLTRRGYGPFFSAMAIHCSRNLGLVVENVMKNDYNLTIKRLEHEERLQELAIKFTETRNAGIRAKHVGLETLNSSITNCASIQDATLKGSCLTAATAIGRFDGDSIKVGKRGVQQVPESIPVPQRVLPMAAYKQAVVAKDKFNLVEATFNTTLLPATVNKTELKALRDKLASDRSQLSIKINAVKTEVSQLLKTERESDLRALQQIRIPLEEDLENVPTDNVLLRQKIIAQLNAQAAEANIERNKYVALADKLTALVSEIETHIEQIEQLKKSDAA